MNSLIGKHFLYELGTGLNLLFTGVLKHLPINGMGYPLYGSITSADVVATLCLILLVLLTNQLVALYFRRKTQVPENQARGLWHRVAGIFGKPLHSLIWILGGYVIIAPLGPKLPPDATWPLLGECLDRVFDLGVFWILFWLFFRLTHAVEAWLAHLASRSASKLDDLFVPLVGKSMRVLLPVVGIIFALPVLDLPPQYSAVFAKGGSILLIVAITLILFEAVGRAELAVLAKFDITVADNLQARKIYTQVHVLGKTLYFVIGLFCVASILMLFEEVRRFGTSLLASAGVVGVILGFAAQKTIANLFAGFQLALTQPIRLDDVVIVEGEWGRIEEITLTYVVIHIWDERRLVVPLSYFIEKPFQNWTRVSSSLMGSVFVWMDYSLPLAEIREAARQVIEQSPLWDRRFWNVQVSDATERTIQIRILATSADSSKSWDLRCEIREKIIAYIQQHHPQSLPQIRASFEGAKPAKAPEP